MNRAELLRRGAVVAVAPWWRLVPRVAADARLTELAKELKGTVVAKGAAGYDAARVAFDTRFDGAKPLAVAYCQSAEDVQRTVRWAAKHGIHIVPRAGGHSYGGYSTVSSGVVVDVTRIAGIAVSGTVAAIGAGARLIDVYSKLAAHGLALPAGSCATVGVAGLALGGGHGFLSRKWGTTSDNILSLRIVTADGTLLTCSPSRNSDLYWACRGGGGGNFGIVTDFQFRVHPVTTVSTFKVNWPWEQAATAIKAFQSFAPYAPDEVFCVCALAAAPGANSVAVAGQMIATKDTTTKTIAPLAAAGTPTRVAVSERAYLDAALMWAGCGTGVDDCHLEPLGKLTRATFAGKSDFYAQPISSAGIDQLLAGLQQRANDSTQGRASVLFDSYGGALNRMPKSATAFVHRGQLFSAQYLAYWDVPSAGAANVAWLRNLYAALRPYASGEAYQNYIDPDLTGWTAAYYGTNYPRLQAVKKKYDPKNSFHFAQSIRLP